MKIVFISHSYPPVMGGIERQNFDLAAGLCRIAPVKIIANKKGKWFLPFFAAYAFFHTCLIMPHYDVCLFGSGILTPLGKVARLFHPRKRFYSVIHGLDITFIYKKGVLARIYKMVNLPCIASMNKLFMVGNATIEEAVKAGVPREKCVFIPNGVNGESLGSDNNRTDLERLFGGKLTGKKLLLRLSRFVPHKGTSWFIENVMPGLPEHIVLAAVGGRVSRKTAGDKDDFMACQKAIIKNRLAHRVRLLAEIPDKDRNVFLNNADLVISPNIKCPGSMEGFGINAIEAAACKRVVVASRLEGLSDAVKDGENGFLAPPGNPAIWIEKIKEVLNSGEPFARSFGERACRYTKKNYAWDKICQTYLEEMKNMRGQ